MEKNEPDFTKSQSFFNYAQAAHRHAYNAGSFEGLNPLERAAAEMEEQRRIECNKPLIDIFEIDGVESKPIENIFFFNTLKDKINAKCGRKYSWFHGALSPRPFWSCSFSISVSATFKAAIRRLRRVCCDLPSFLASIFSHLLSVDSKARSASLNSSDVKSGIFNPPLVSPSTARCR